MRKIKLTLFEGIVACTILPNIILAFISILLIISLFVQQEPIVYKLLIILSLSCIFLLIVSLLICILVVRKSKKDLILEEESFTVFNRTYDYSQIISVTYYKCKWYTIPLVPFYQAGGTIELVLFDNSMIEFKLLYKDYIIVKNKIKNIDIKEKTLGQMLR